MYSAGFRDPDLEGMVQLVGGLGVQGGVEDPSGAIDLAALDLFHRGQNGQLHHHSTVQQEVSRFM